MKIMNATKSFGELTVLKDLSMDFPDNGVVCLFGPSGCGKTTLLNAICGLVELDSGKIQGAPLRISYMFQENRLLPWFDALTNVSAVAGISAEEAARWLGEAGLPGEAFAKLPGELSGGMQRRVALARAFAFGGDIILLDEPFKGLDEKTKNDISQRLLSKAENKLIIFVTHDSLEAAQISDVIYLLQGPPLTIADRITVAADERDSITYRLRHE